MVRRYYVHILLPSNYVLRNMRELHHLAHQIEAHDNADFHDDRYAVCENLRPTVTKWRDEACAEYIAWSTRMEYSFKLHDMAVCCTRPRRARFSRDGCTIVLAG